MFSFPLRLAAMYYRATIKIMNYSQYASLNEEAVSELFKQRLEELQRSCRRSYRQPIVGHKQLDMYQLFRAVQARGGAKNVTQWKDIGKKLGLPASVTNAGYTLRTKYESHILPYEEILCNEFPQTDLPDPSLNSTLRGVTAISAPMSLTPHVNRVLENPHSSPQLVEPTHNIGDAIMYPNEDAPYHQPLSAFSANSTSPTQLPASNNWLVKQSEIRTQDPSAANLGNSFDANMQPSHNNLSNLQFNPNQGLLNSPRSSYDFQRIQFATQSSGKQIQYHSALARHSMLKRVNIRNQSFTDDTIATFLSSLPSVEILAIGSLRNLTRMFDPSLLPISLVSLQLDELPSNLLETALQVIKSRDIHDLSVTIYNPEVKSTLVDRSKWDGHESAEAGGTSNNMITHHHEPFITYNNTGVMGQESLEYHRPHIEIHTASPIKKVASNESSLSIDQGPGAIIDYSDHSNVGHFHDWHDPINDFNY